jgi:hypothetical protein
MGWLGWTEQETLDTSMPSIVLAHKGKLEMLQACYGSDSTTAGGQNEPPTAGPESVQPITQERVQSLFKTLAG